MNTKAIWSSRDDENNRSFTIKLPQSEIGRPSKRTEREVLTFLDRFMGSLGPDSYIGMAFDGFLSMAYENIESDMGNSVNNFKEMWRNAEDAANRFNSKLREVEKELDSTKSAYNTLLSNYSQALDDIETTKKDVSFKLFDNASQMADLQRQIEVLKNENIRLKAKMYDLIVGEDE